MQSHLAECPACAKHDTTMRRGLMVFRSLPLIHPSPDFFDRLSNKLQQIERADARAALYRGPGVGSFFAAAVGVIGMGFLAALLFNWMAPARDLRLAPVVATRPALAPAPVIGVGFVTTASAGVPMWPAAMIADEAPVHFASETLGIEH